MISWICACVRTARGRRARDDEPRVNARGGGVCVTFAARAGLNAANDPAQVRSLHPRHKVPRRSPRRLAAPLFRWNSFGANTSTRTFDWRNMRGAPDWSCAKTSL